MLLRFTKMHGLGNDFMVLDLVSQHAHIQPKHAKQWGDRHTGVGFDQLLIVEAPNNPEVDFRYRIFNADGSEVEQCGNGARCFARFVLDKRLTAKKRIRVETKSGIIVLDVQNDGQVSVDMGPPRFIPAEIPFVADAQALNYPLEVDGQLHSIAAVSMGNPHAVLRVDDVQTAPVHELGPKIENHPRFPQRVNAGFIQVIDRHRANLRVWERGAERNPGLRHRRLRRGRGGDQPGLDGLPGVPRPARWPPAHRMGRPRQARDDDRPGRTRLRRTGSSLNE